MNRSEKELNERLSQLKQETLKRGFDRFPKVLEQVSDLPVELQSPALDSLVANQDIHPIIAFPPQIHRGWHYIPKQALLFMSGAVIHLQASIWPGEEPQVTFLKGSDILSMKVTLLLLYGRLEIVAPDRAALTRLSMEFNTIAWDYLSPHLRRLLQETQSRPCALPEQIMHAQAAQRVWENLPLKFFNGVEIYGLLPGEALEELVFQPGVWKRRLLIFRRPILANTLLLLTSNYMVVIQEELGMEQGWILSYLPRSNIVGMRSQPHGLWDELIILLKRGDQTAEFPLLLKDEAAQTWQERWAHMGPHQA